MVNPSNILFLRFTILDGLDSLYYSMARAPAGRVRRRAKNNTYGKSEIRPGQTESCYCFFFFFFCWGFAKKRPGLHNTAMRWIRPLVLSRCLFVISRGTTPATRTLCAPGQALTILKKTKYLKYRSDYEKTRGLPDDRPKNYRLTQPVYLEKY